MDKWSLTEGRRSQLRARITKLDPTPSADRDIAMIKIGEGYAQKKLIEYIEDNFRVYDGSRIQVGMITTTKWQQLREGVGLE